MNVLILVHNQARKGGAYYHGQCFAKALATQGHSVTLMAIDPTARVGFTVEELPEFTLVRTPDLLWGIGRTGWDPWDTLRRCLFLRSHDFDVIHAVDTRPAVVLPALYARRANGGVFVADWTDWWGRGGATSERDGWLVRTVMGPVEQFFEEHFRAYADGTITISQALHDRAAGLGIDPATMEIIPPASDTDDVQRIDKAAAREALGVSQDDKLVGYLGNIYPRDGALLSDAMRRLNAQDAKLVMIGGADIGADHGLGDRLLETGHVPFPDMVRWLNACDVLTLPLTDSIANRGRWPSKINDYLAVGRPTVASAVGDMTTLFEQAEIGFTVAPDDHAPEQFAARIDQLLADPAAAQAMGDAARSLAETAYSMTTIGQKLADFYTATMQRAKP